MAVLLTSVFGATGCGSDDVPPAESRIKNSNYGELDYTDLIESDLNDDGSDHDAHNLDDIDPYDIDIYKYLKHDKVNTNQMKTRYTED